MAAISVRQTEKARGAVSKCGARHASAVNADGVRRGRFAEQFLSLLKKQRLTVDCALLLWSRVTQIGGRNTRKDDAIGRGGRSYRQCHPALIGLRSPEQNAHLLRLNRGLTETDNVRRGRGLQSRQTDGRRQIGQQPALLG